MKSSNPAFREKTWADAAQGTRGEVMTLNGTAVKAGVLGGLVVLSAAWPWHLFFSNNVSPDVLMPYIFGGGIGGFITAMICIFNQKSAPITAPIYAVLEGLCLGAISATYEYKYPGVAIQAVGLSFAVLGAFLFSYTTGLIRPSSGFLRGISLATMGIAIYYVVALIMGCFGLHAPMIYNTGMIGIGFSLFVTAIAAFNLFIDFNFIDRSVQQGAPKYMEWYGAFGLMLTLVWMYLEMLRLMSKLSRR
jgi:uncharacterized YccA/Bax inhibitor family protein